MTAGRPAVFAGAAVLVLLVLLSLFRIPPIDMPWHLATGRIIVEEARLPTANTFSWTFPDHPLYQQYPLFQAGCFLIVERLGWECLSLTMGALWTLAVLSWLRWAAPPRALLAHPFLLLVVVVGVQRHMLARPEVLLLLLLGIMLLCIEGVRAGRAPAAFGLVAAEWLMVWSHQLFWLGLALQLLLLADVVATSRFAGRFGLPLVERSCPVHVPAVALVASIASVGVSPLGWRAYLVPLETLRTVVTQGHVAGNAHAQELRPVWSDPIASIVVCMLIAVVVVGLARGSRRLAPLEAGVLLMGIFAVLAAVRGISLFALAAGAVAIRVVRRAPPLLASVPALRSGVSVTVAGAAIALGGRVYASPPAFLHVQRGLGRSQGEWADHAIAFLRRAPPPGRMLNLGWVTGNPMIWGLYPEQRVFVDPRWETYPKPFLLRCIGAADDEAVLAGLIDEFDPNWIVGEMRLPNVQRRIGELLRTGRWRPVYADTLLIVVVRDRPESREYLARHALDLTHWEPPDWIPSEPVLHAQQQIRVARLFIELGMPVRARDLLRAARSGKGNRSVLADLAALDRPPAGITPR